MPSKYYAMFEITRTQEETTGSVGPDNYEVGMFPAYPFSNGTWTDAHTPGGSQAKALQLPTSFQVLGASDLYRYYRPYYSTIEVVVKGTTGANYSSMSCTVIPVTLDQLTSPNILACSESSQYPRAKAIQMNSSGNMLMNVSDRRECKITHKASIADLWGTTKMAVMTEDDYSATCPSGQPNNRAYWQIWVYTNDKANPQTATMAYNIYVKCRFYVRLEDLASTSATT